MISYAVLSVCKNSRTITTVYLCVYLSCEVEGWGLGNGTVHLPEHLTELRHHGSKVVEKSLHWLLKNGTHRLRDNMRSALLKCHVLLCGLISFKEQKTNRVLPVRGCTWRRLTSTTCESFSHLPSTVCMRANTCCKTTTTWKHKVKRSNRNEKTVLNKQ